MKLRVNKAPPSLARPEIRRSKLARHAVAHQERRREARNNSDKRSRARESFRCIKSSRRKLETVFGLGHSFHFTNSDLFRISCFDIRNFFPRDLNPFTYHPPSPAWATSWQADHPPTPRLLRKRSRAGGAAGHSLPPSTLPIHPYEN